MLAMVLYKQRIDQGKTDQQEERSFRMNGIWSKKSVICLCIAAAVAAASISLPGCSRKKPGIPSSAATTAVSDVATAAGVKPASSAPSMPMVVSSQGEFIYYVNTVYHFNYRLPASWKGFTVVQETWSGRVYDELSKSYTGRTETGPKLLIRHPLWTKENPREDLPVMIFNHAQWQLIEQERLVVSAAPIGPSEMGRNSEWVFALPARWNFDNLPGVEEATEIVEGKPLTPTGRVESTPPPPDR